MPTRKPRAASKPKKVTKNRRPSRWQQFLDKKYAWPLIVFLAFALVGGIVLIISSQAASKPLPFDMPSQSALKGSSKKVFAHYFTPYPISLDNKTSDVDYYTRNYLSPSGESGKHAAYGGLLRERPLPRKVDASSSWQLNDMKTEVSRATEAGLDGFTVDMLGLSGTHWERLKLLLQASKEVDPNFKIVLMPDANSSVVSSPAALARSINELTKNYNSSLYRLNDGRLVVSPFYAEKVGAGWWAEWLGIMQNTYGIKVAFVPCFLNYGSNVNAFNSISYGFSNWGNRNPAANKSLSSNIADAHKRGKIWMQPVSVQDARPNQGIYDEANNTENLRTTWNAAINGADWVQIPTWNDYSEGAEIAPSTSIGYGPLDISSYYLSRFKTGAWPTIKRDVVYLSHRTQFAGAKPTGGQTKIMQLRGGSSPARDTVEILAYLTSQSTVKVTIGSKVHTYTAPAGESVQVYPLQTGKIKVEVTRSGAAVTSVASPFTVQSSVPVQDMLYHFVGSSRDGSGTQESPTPTPPSPTPTPTPPTPAPGPAPTPTPSSATGAIKGGAGLCLDNHRGNKTNGNKIQFYRCNGTAAQQWTVYRDGTIKNANGFCLDVKGGSRRPRTPVQLYQCNGSLAQKWDINHAQGTITNPNSGLCLDNKYAKKVNNNPIWMYPCNGTIAQKWAAPKL